MDNFKNINDHFCVFKSIKFMPLPSDASMLAYLPNNTDAIPELI